MTEKVEAERKASSDSGRGEREAMDSSVDTAMIGRDRQQGGKVDGVANTESTR